MTGHHNASSSSSSSLSSRRTCRPARRTNRGSGAGRQLKVSAMNSSERSKYYRQLRAKVVATLQATTRRLHDEVAWAELTLLLHRRLTPTIAPVIRIRAVESLKEFVTKHVMTENFGLVDARRAIRHVDVLYGGPPSPILHVRYSIQGRLHTLAVEKLYPFVVGNTLALARMLHEDIELDYQFTAFFDAEGRLERVEIDRGELMALSRPVFGLSTAARILTEISPTRTRQTAEQGQISSQHAVNTCESSCAPIASSEHCCGRVVAMEGHRKTLSRAQTPGKPSRGFPYIATD